MISQFKVLSDPRFKLVHDITQAFSEGPNSKELRILHTGYTLEKNIKKGAELYPNTLIGIHSDPDNGHMLAPIRGKITEVGPRFIHVERTEAQPEDEIVNPLAQEELEAIFSLKDKEEAKEKIRALGLNLRNIAKPCKTLIVSGLNSEPGIMWAEPLLNIHLKTVLAGLKLQKLFAEPARIIFVIPNDERLTLDESNENIEIRHIDPIYPITIPALLKKEVVDDENPSDIDVVSVHALWGLGRVAETGLPLTETVVTVGAPGHGGNYIIKEGTRAIDLLTHTNFPLEQGDTIVLNGPLRGASIALAERGIPKHIKGVFVVPKDTVPSLEGNNPCCNCGECDRHCPANLSPSIISRYAEFHHYDKCEEWYSEYCLDCGLCGFFCIMRRPVLQYIRLANKQILLAAKAVVIESAEDIKAKKEAVAERADSIKAKVEEATETKEEIKAEIKAEKAKSVEAKTEVKVETAKTEEVKVEATTEEIKAEPKSEIKVEEVKTEAKVEEVKPEVKQEVKPEVKPEVKLEVKPEAKTEEKPVVEAEVKPVAKVKTEEVKAKPKPETKPETKPEITVEAKNEKVATKTETKAKTTKAKTTKAKSNKSTKTKKSEK